VRSLALALALAGYAGPLQAMGGPQSKGDVTVESCGASEVTAASVLQAGNREGHDPGSQPGGMIQRLQANAKTLHRRGSRGLLDVFTFPDRRRMISQA
jgi:hypothetical protein